MDQAERQNLSSRTEPEQPRWLGLLAIGVIILAGGIAYGNSFGGSFVFDDTASILENPTCTSPRSIWAPFDPPRGDRTVSGRPLLNSTFAANYALGQSDVFGYHLVNLVIHLAAGFVLWLVAWRTLANASLPEAAQNGAPWLALCAAVVWVAHPLQTASVTYIVQRAESLAALFSLLTLYCVIRAARSPRRFWTGRAIVSCALAMASKETAVVTPFLILLYDRLFLAGSLRAALRLRWPLYAGLAACVGLLAALILTGGRLGSSVNGPGADRWAYLAAQPAFVLKYLRLAFWPDDLVFDYGDDPRLTPYPAAVATPVVLALVAVTALSFRYCPPLGFAGVWFFAQLAPSSSVIPVSTQVAAEHRVYLALAAPVVVVVVLVYLGLRRALSHGMVRLAGAVALAAVLVALIMSSRWRNTDYFSAQTLWQDTARNAPANPRAWHNLSVALDDRGDQTGALEAIDTAIQLRHDGESFGVRAYLYQRLNRLPEAEADYLEAVAAGVAHPRIFFNLGVVSNTLGKRKQALAAFERSIQLDPAPPDVYFDRGSVFAAEDQPEAAIADYSRAIARNPRFSEAYVSRAECYARLKKYANAIQDLSQAHQLQPERLDVLMARARASVALGAYARADADVAAIVKAGGKPDPETVRAIQELRTAVRSPGPPN